jgi:biopolymer transport protein ExbD
MNRDTKGIPMDTVDAAGNHHLSQLYIWINSARVEEYKVRKQMQDEGKPTEDLRYAIKADGKSAYKKVDAVINVFKKQEVFTFNLITSLEGDPNMVTPPAK